MPPNGFHPGETVYIFLSTVIQGNQLQSRSDSLVLCSSIYCTEKDGEGHARDQDQFFKNVVNQVISGQPVSIHKASSLTNKQRVNHCCS